MSNDDLNGDKWSDSDIVAAIDRTNDQIAKVASCINTTNRLLKEWIDTSGAGVDSQLLMYISLKCYELMPDERLALYDQLKQKKDAGQLPEKWYLQDIETLLATPSIEGGA